jgi:hypothetical protein
LLFDPTVSYSSTDEVSQRVGDRLRYIWKKLYTKPESHSTQDLFEMLKLFAKKPIRSTAVRMFQEENYAHKIKPLVDVEIARLNGLNVKFHTVSIVHKISEQVFNAESAGVREFYQKQVDERYADEMRAYEELTEIGAGEELLPEQRHECVSIFLFFLNLRTDDAVVGESQTFFLSFSVSLTPSNALLDLSVFSLLLAYFLPKTAHQLSNLPGMSDLSPNEIMALTECISVFMQANPVMHTPNTGSRTTHWATE